MNDQVAFVPFHALSRFMRDDYRLTVIRAALAALPGLSADVRRAVDRQIQRHVRVPGFRNSVKAPAALKVRPAAEAFEKQAELAAAILAAWAEAHSALRQQVFDLLAARGWELLPLEADRTKLPGFLTRWPPKEDFERLNQAFSGQYPDSPATSDDVSLMAVWVSGRLPLEAHDDEPASLEEEAEQAGG